MAVKHTPTGKVHQGQKGNTTGCGIDTTEHLDHWVNSYANVNCNKNGCKN